jgi:hypothetical protein
VLSKFFGMEMSVDSGPVSAFLLRAGYNRSQGARRLRQEVDRQFNLAALSCALSSTRPSEGKFYYETSVGRLLLL